MAGDPAVDTSTVSKKAEAALLYKQKAYARRMCKDVLESYVECCRTHTLSTVWSCRDQMNIVNACLAPYTNEEEMDNIKRKWIKAGRPNDPSWDPNT